MTGCKHDSLEKCCFCKASDIAAYELTGSHDKKKQAEYWAAVFAKVKELRERKRA